MCRLVIYRTSTCYHIPSAFPQQMSGDCYHTICVSEPGAAFTLSFTNAKIIADLSVGKTCHDLIPGQSGEQLAYTITVTNHGPNTASNVLLSDSLPSQVTNAKFAIDGSTESDWTGSTTFASMASGTSHTIAIYGDIASTVTSVDQNTATVTSDTFDNVLTNNAASCTNLLTYADVSVSKTCHDLVPGKADQPAYTIVVTNNGPNTASNVLLSDSLPSQVTDAKFAIDGSTESDWTGSTTFASMASGTSHTIVIYGDLASTVTSVDQNTATVTSDTFDNVLTNNAASCTNLLTYADVSVSKTCHDLVPGKADQPAYTIVVTNNGPNTASNVLLSDSLPSQVTNAKFTIDGSTESDWTGSTTFASMASGTSHTIAIYGDIASTVTSVDQNTATVTSDTFDNVLTNNAASCTNLLTYADVSVSKTCHDLVPGKADQLAYTIVVTNSGPNTASNVLLSDSLPSQVTNAKFTIDGSTESDWTGSTTFASMASGTSHTIAIYGDIASTVTSVDQNTATVTSDTFDNVLTNNAASCTNLLTKIMQPAARIC